MGIPSRRILCKFPACPHGHLAPCSYFHGTVPPHCPLHIFFIKLTFIHDLLIFYNILHSHFIHRSQYSPIRSQFFHFLPEDPGAIIHSRCREHNTILQANNAKLSFTISERTELSTGSCQPHRYLEVFNHERNHKRTDPAVHCRLRRAAEPHQSLMY